MYSNLSIILFFFLFFFFKLFFVSSVLYILLLFRSFSQSSYCCHFCVSSGFLSCIGNFAVGFAITLAFVICQLIFLFLPLRNKNADASVWSSNLQLVAGLCASNQTNGRQPRHFFMALQNMSIMYSIPSPMSCHLIVVGEFACPNESGSYFARGFKPLVGSPKANRDQTKNSS